MLENANLTGADLNSANLSGAILVHADLTRALLLKADRPDDEDRGELHIRSATPDTGSEWTDDGSMREMRHLAHRAEGDSRIVPTHPELTRLLRQHVLGTESRRSRP